jgi:hypothetical protein
MKMMEENEDAKSREWEQRIDERKHGAPTELGRFFAGRFYNHAGPDGPQSGGED